ncbi:MAG TPA: hypothetical protein VFP80_05590 [Thermoanaerobaculia bacterium]|nr:hypothetical protein [Thermoanaerobaculia bacterium]
MPLEERDLLQADLPVIRRAVDDLLATTAPAGHQEAYAVVRYTGDGKETYACLVVSYPDLFQDATGRGGFLNHARLVRVSEPSLDAAALFEVAGDFPYREVCEVEASERRNAYIGKVAMEEPAIGVRAVAAAELQDIPRELLTDFLIGCLVHIGQKKGEPVLLRDDDPAKLVRAWAALPLGLQRKSSWAVRVASCPVDVVFTRSQGKAASKDANKTLVETVQHYVSLLHDAPGRVDAILSNPAITTAGELREAVFSAAPTAAGTTPIPIAGQEEMAKNKAKAKVVPDQQWDPVHPDDVAGLSRQYKAMEASLRRIIDERFEALEVRQRSQQRSQPPAVSRAKGDGGSVEPWWRWRWLPLVAATVVSLVVVAAVLFWPDRKAREPERPRETFSQPSPAPADDTPDPVPAEKPGSRAVSAAEQSQATNAWAEALKGLLESDRTLVVRTIEDLSVNAPEDVRDQLDEFVVRIGRGEDLGSEGPRSRERLRELLLDCIAFESVLPDVKVDGKLADVAPHIDKLKKQSGVKSKVRDPASRELQSEIILRWIASRE